MAKKKKKNNDRDGIVYSTNPNLNFDSVNDEDASAVPASEQQIRVMLDKKQRAGKVVTLITGFELRESELNEIGKWLKGKCGSGGSVKDGEVLIQGDKRDFIVKLLQEKGYKPKKSGG